LAALPSAPMAPKNVMIGDAVQPSNRLKWESVEDKNLIGYKIYWRDTTSSQCQYSRFVGKVTDYTLKNIVIDNYLFGVAAVGEKIAVLYN